METSIYCCCSPACVCLQIASLVSEGQVELYQRLSFERGRCCPPPLLVVLQGLYFLAQKAETQL